MICQKCNNNVATIKITQVVKNERFDFFLCTDCVKDLGMDDPFSDISGEISRAIFSIIQEQLEGIEQIPDMSCDYCNLNLKEFAEKGLLGCPECYRSFDQYLKVLLRRYHGTNTHKIISKRKKTKSSDYKKINVLESRLQVALENEDFENAAILRDEIKELKERNQT